MICSKCNNPIPDNVQFCPFCGEPVQNMEPKPPVPPFAPDSVQPQRKKAGKGLTVFATVLAVVAASFLGIALYFFIQPGAVSKNDAAGKSGDADATGQTANYADAADTADAADAANAAAANEGEAVSEEVQAAAGKAQTAQDEGAQTGAGDGEGAAAEKAVPSTPILQVEDVHEEGANGGCTLDYSRVSLGSGTDSVFPELNESLKSYSDEQIAGVVEEYNTLLPVAEEIDRGLFVSMSLCLVRADERALSLHYDFSDYSGGAHGYYWDGGATFDTKTGARLALKDICTDTGELARIVAASLFAEDASRFSVSEADLTQNILENQLNPENTDSWFSTPEGLHFFFPPYSISYYAAGEPDVFVRFADHANIFNEAYVSTQSAYVEYDPREDSFARFDFDNDGNMNSIRLFNEYLQGEGASLTYQNFKIYLDEVEVCEQQTAAYRAAHTCRVKSDGRALYVVETENVDGTNTSYVFEVKGGTAMLAGSVSGGVYARTVNEAGQSVVLQSSEPSQIGDGSFYVDFFT